MLKSVGRFFIFKSTTMAHHFTKSYQSPGDLVKLLQKRGLTVSNAIKAEEYIQNIGYYRLSAYLCIVRDLSQESET